MYVKSCHNGILFLWKKETFYDQLTGYFKELSDGIPRLQIIALFHSFYVQSVLF